MNAALFLLIGFPLAASPFVYFAGRVRTRHHGSASAARGLALLALASLWLIFASIALESNATARFTIGAVPFQVDGISRLVIGVALTLMLPVLIFSLRDVKDETGEEKYYTLLIAMMGAVIGLACSADLFNLWMWFEALALSSYFLVMFHRQQSLEAGLKYFVQSAVGSVLILLGTALVLMQTGVLGFEEIRQTAVSDPLLLAAGALLVTGFGIKVAIVPLHTWLPDAHSQAPSGVSALLSGIVIEVALVALLRVLAALSGVSFTWGGLLMGFGAVNMLMGNLLALRQTQVKRMLAYSSVSHVGYMLVAFGIALVSGEVVAAQGGFFHLFTHSLMKGVVFLAAGALLYALNRHSLMVSDLSGAGYRYPVVSLALTLGLLSLGGLPPLAGFLSKWQIFVGGFAAQNTTISALMIFAALNSLFSLAYYMPLINRLYRQKPALEGKHLPFAMTAPLVVLALLLVLLGLFPDLAAGLTEPAARALLAAFGA